MDASSVADLVQQIIVLNSWFNFGAGMSALIGNSFTQYIVAYLVIVILDQTKRAFSSRKTTHCMFVFPQLYCLCSLELLDYF